MGTQSLSNTSKTFSMATWDKIKPKYYLISSSSSSSLLLLLLNDAKTLFSLNFQTKKANHSQNKKSMQIVSENIVIISN